MLERAMTWIPTMEQAFASYNQVVDKTAPDKRGQLPHIQVKIFEALISGTLAFLNKNPQDSTNATAIGRIQEYATHVKTRGQFVIGTAELLHCKLVKAHSKVNIKLELMIIPGTQTMAIWNDIIGSLLTTQGGRRQHGVEPRGDLERKLQKWLDEA